METTINLYNKIEEVLKENYCTIRDIDCIKMYSDFNIVELNRDKFLNIIKKDNKICQLQKSPFLEKGFIFIILFGDEEYITIDKNMNVIFHKQKYINKELTIRKIIGVV